MKEKLSQVYIFTGLIFFITIICLYGMFLMRKDITIIKDEKVIEVSTFMPTVKEAIKENNIHLSYKDSIKPELSHQIQNNMVVEIKKAFPVHITDGGYKRIVNTSKNTVKEVIDESGYFVNENDKVIPNIDSIAYKDMQIEIIRVITEYITEEETIGYEIKRVDNNSMEKGFSSIKQQGKEGLKEIEYKVTYENGMEVNREKTSERIIKEPVDRIVQYGTIDSFVTASGEKIQYQKAFLMEATAYHAGYESTGKRPGDPHYGITFTGIPVRTGIVAVDPNVIPLGSKLYVQGYGIALAADIGSAIIGKRIDLYYETYEEAMRYGRRNIKVYLLEN